MMLTKRENLLETIHGGHPDRYVNQYEAFALLMGSPFGNRNPRPKRGEMNVKNAWGITRSWPPHVPASFPDHSPEKMVIKDISHWQDYLKVPNVVYDAQEWEPFIAQAEAVDRKEQFCTCAVLPGVFEQCHMLMDVESCLVALYENPDELHQLIDVITQFELDYAAEICKYLKPDAIFHHDDWGTQRSTFFSREMFQEFFKPSYEKIYGFYKAHGVELIIHHSDSYAATLVPDMIDMGIDIWQGVMEANDVPALIRQYGGKISFMGGIDSAHIDYEGWTEEVIGQQVERAVTQCGKLYFIPGASIGLNTSTYPGVYDATTRQIELASKRHFG